MSGRQGFFEKQDQHALDKGWMTGFDNKDRLESLRATLAETEQLYKSADQQFQTSIKTAKALKNESHLLQQIIELRFDIIDLPSALIELEKLQQRLQALTAPDSDLAKAKREYEATEKNLKSIREAINTLNMVLGSLESEHKQACQQQQNAFTRIGEGLSDTEI
jgi:uncharacterized protein YPO0396